MRRLQSVFIGALMIAALCGSAALGGTISILPSQDNSIYSESDNSNALGGLFTGVTPSGGERRALMQFNVAGNVPAGAIINSVSLSLTQTKVGPGGTADFEFHPLMAAWGQGTSIGSGSGGSPTSGDATWNYRLYNTDTWSSPGGDFGGVSGTETFSGNGQYTVGSQAGLVTDVQNWLDSPGSNFGWILMNSSPPAPLPTSARQFASSESGSGQPTLTIDFSVVPEPSTWILLCAAAIFASAYKLRNGRFCTALGK